MERKHPAKASHVWHGILADQARNGDQSGGICMPAQLWACLPSEPPSCLPAVASLPHGREKAAVNKNIGQTCSLALPQQICPGQTAFFQHVRKARGLAVSLLLHAFFLWPLLAFSFHAVQDMPRKTIGVSLVSLAPALASGASTAVLAEGAPPPPAVPVQPQHIAHVQQAPAHTALADTRPKPVPPKKTAMPSAHKKERVRPSSAPENHKAATPPASSQAQAASGSKAANTVASPGPDPDLAAASGADKVYSPRQLDQSPAVTKGMKPEYPASARSRKVEGRVVVRMVVEPSGQPGQCSIHSATPQGYFEEAALDAARRMRFRPGTKAGKAVRTLVLLPFDFNLR